MRRLVGLAVCLSLSLAAAVALHAIGELPAWAYAIGPPVPPAGPDPTPQVLPGTPLKFTLAQIRDGFGPADWYPQDHPAMPRIVSHGRAPGIRACSLCHYPNGKGRPENSGIAGLPVSYFIQQMEDYRHGLRKSADPRKTNTTGMIDIAKGMTSEEIVAAAEYYGAMKWTPWIRVVESANVPRTRIQGGIYLPLEGGGTEPIGVRIIETPENVEHTEALRDPRSGFIAYVPVGSIRRGERLVATGANGRTVQCGPCHGDDLRGLGPVPGIAGRSPSYLVRQMYDMQVGARRGEWAALMKPVVDKLTDEDFVAIAAYVSSRTP